MLDPETEITLVTFAHEGAHLALCHKTQGFSANNKPQPLLVKAENEVVTKEATAALESIAKAAHAEVQIQTDMFTFLRKWMNMYWDDADALSRILGYTGDGSEEPDLWVAEKMDGIKLLKAGVITDKATQKDIDQLAEFIKANDLQNSFSGGNSVDEITVDKTTEKPSENNPKNQGELMPTDQEKLDKATADLDTMATQMAELIKSNADAKIREDSMTAKVEGFEKAATARVEAAFEAKVEEYSFVTPEEKAEFAKTLIAAGNDAIVAVLDKAQAAIVALGAPQGVETKDVEAIDKTTDDSMMKKIMAQYGLTGDAK